MIRIKTILSRLFSAGAAKRYRLGSAVVMLLALSHCAQLPDIDAAPPGAGTPLAAEPAIPTETTATGIQAKPTLTADLQAQFQQAKQLLREQQYQAALTLLQPLAQQVPAAAGIGYNLAICYWQLQQPEQARQQLHAVLKHDPAYVDAANLLGVLARQAGDFNQARRHWLDALAQQQHFASAHKNLGFLYELYLAQPEQARYHYLQYQQLTGDPLVEAWLSLLEPQQE
ncbi:hypothetical protein WG68_17370 [Arsukibacterium ikkense]|uniref:Uncharacterized protein n=1 Tax=Arsukibacterium ikkense TaxID=336831 RepID=A0A0M2V0H6_9GAMM|nr:tetratricopeptide repeat protein [Arsukibacterium ikkense]KKO44086.1 hypothetical protein WG68_17370 [Arsukibacterium ikkense]